MSYDVSRCGRIVWIADVIAILKPFEANNIRNKSYRTLYVDHLDA